MKRTSMNQAHIVALPIVAVLCIFGTQAVPAQTGDTVDLSGTTTINGTMQGSYGLAIDTNNPPRYPENTQPADTFTIEQYDDMGLFQWSNSHPVDGNGFSDSLRVTAPTRYFSSTESWSGGLIGLQQPRNAMSFGDRSESFLSLSVNPRTTLGLQLNGTQLRFRGTAEVTTDNSGTRFHYQVFDPTTQDYAFATPADVDSGLNASWNTSGSLNAKIEINRRHRYEYTGDRAGSGVWGPGTYNVGQSVSASASSMTGQSQTSSDSFSFDLTLAPIERHLTLITHGWLSDGEAFPDQMRDNIVQRLGDRRQFAAQNLGLNADHIEINPGLSWSEHDTTLRGIKTNEKDQWDVVSFDWSDSASLLNTWLLPTNASRHAASLGDRFGELIADAGYDSIHLIGHSAGSWFIDAVADKVEAHAQANGTEKPPVHLTFLDSFIGPFSSNADLGDNGDWVEHYVHQGGLPFTNHFLDNGFTIDITELDPTPESADSFFRPLSRWTNGHSFPVEFYMGTTLQPFQPDIILLDEQVQAATPEFIEIDGDDMIPTYGWGFQNSLEMDGFLPNHETNARGTGIGLTKAGVVQAAVQQPDPLVLSDTGFDFVAGRALGGGEADGLTSSGVTLRLAKQVTATTATEPFDGNTVLSSNAGFDVDLPPPSFSSLDPLFFTLDVELTEPAELMRFDLLFEQIGTGVLYIGIQDTWLYVTTADSFDQNVLYDSGWLYLGDGLIPGTHEVMFALDRLDTSETSVRIENLQFGRSINVIPEPGTLLITAPVFLALARRRAHHRAAA